MTAFTRIILLLAFVLAISTVSFAQEGSITGSVHDASGAVIPNAMVTVTNVDQGWVRIVKSNSTGEYLVPGLPAGSYNIQVQAAGFQRYEVKALVLRVAEKSRTDAVLTVGQISTEVDVAGASVSQVQTESAELSGVVTSKQIDQLVLNGRNFTQLITLIPGVSNQTGQDEGTVGVYGSVAFSVNGGRTEYNNWELDGGDNMDNGSNSTLNTYPNVDAIAEVKVLTSNYGAQYGRNGSATVETITKSGTKDFHGDLFEFLRNEDFNARNFFADSTPIYRKNDYGFTLGGPVFIPHLYNSSRQKTFFFWSEDWRKELVPGTVFNQQVPSAAERAGNFSADCPGSGSSVDAVNYPNCPVNPSTGQYYPGNTVPVTAQAQAILPLIPLPNTSSGFFNASPAQQTNWREDLVRLDENITDKQRFFFRFIHDSWSTVTATPLWGSGSFPTVGTNFVGPGVALVANLTSTVSPSLVNEFMFGYTTDHIFLTAVPNPTRPVSFDMPGIYDNGFDGILPNVNIQDTGEYGGGFSAGTGYFPWNNANPTYTFKDNVTKIIGSHNLFFGASFVAAQKNEDSTGDVQGTLTFGPPSTYSTGNGFADFLVGSVAAFDQTNQEAKYYNRYKIVEPYFQDDWHVNKKLTLNLGLRVSLFGTYREKYKQAYNFEPSAYNPATAPVYGANGLISGNPFDGIVQCGSAGIPAGCLKGHLFNPAPRVGFAYSPSGDGKTSIRGGYGIFFEHTNGNEGNTESLEGSAPYVQDVTEFNLPSYTSITSGGLVSGPLNVTAIPTRAIWPYVQQWNLSVQHDFTTDTLVTVAYAGSKGTHLTDQTNINQLQPLAASQNPYAPGQAIQANDCSTLTVNGLPVTGAAVQNLNVACGNVSPNIYRPYQGFGTITNLEDQANSSYNSLQVSARRNVGHLTMSLAYTWSHSIDDSSDRYDGSFVNSYDLAYTRASSNFDQRQLLNISYVYDLPFFTKAGLLHSVLGGWQVSGLVEYQTGTPFSITNGTTYGDNAGVGNGVGTGSYVDVIGNPFAVPAQTQTAGVQGPLLFNPGAFADPTGLTFGNAGRNILNNPARTNWDSGLFKRFYIGHTETRAFEFRAEGFNILNHTQWSGVNSGTTCYGTDNSAGDPTCVYGNATTTGSTFLHPGGAHNPRILQLGLKFIF